MSRVLQGKVVSTRMEKTIVVAIERRKTHPIYKKSYLVTTRFQAHDAKGEAGLGDIVEIIETKPISRHKHFMLNKVIEKAIQTKGDTA
jgi:small subunit ribosomal protein S17